MVDSLSLDLRKRIVAAYRAQKGTYVEIASQFQVGGASVSRLL
jgi:transposase-like protein